MPNDWNGRNVVGGQSIPRIPSSRGVLKFSFKDSSTTNQLVSKVDHRRDSYSRCFTSR